MHRYTPEQIRFYPKIVGFWKSKYFQHDVKEHDVKDGMGRGRDVKVFANARKNPRSFSHENKNAWSIKSHFRKRLKRMEKMEIL